MDSGITFLSDVSLLFVLRSIFLLELTKSNMEEILANDGRISVMRISGYFWDSSCKRDWLSMYFSGSIENILFSTLMGMSLRWTSPKLEYNNFSYPSVIGAVILVLTVFSHSDTTSSTNKSPYKKLKLFFA